MAAARLGMAAFAATLVQTAKGQYGVAAGRARLFEGPRFPTEPAGWPIRAWQPRRASAPTPRTQHPRQHELRALEPSGERAHLTFSSGERTVHPDHRTLRSNYYYHLDIHRRCPLNLRRNCSGKKLPMKLRTLSHWRRCCGCFVSSYRRLLFPESLPRSHHLLRSGRQLPHGSRAPCWLDG